MELDVLVSPIDLLKHGVHAVFPPSRMMRVTISSATFSRAWRTSVKRPCRCFHGVVDQVSKEFCAAATASSKSWGDAQGTSHKLFPVDGSIACDVFPLLWDFPSMVFENTSKLG